MSLQTRLGALITAIGADIKTLNTQMASVPRPGTAGYIRSVGRGVDGSNINSSNSGITLVADGVLSLPVAANEVCFFETYLQFFTANVTMDTRFSMAGPAGSTVRWGFAAAAGASAIGYGVWAASGSGSATFLSSGNYVVVGGGSGITNGTALAGVVINGATPGNLTVSLAQNVADAGNLRMLAGSMLRTTLLA